MLTSELIRKLQESVKLNGDLEIGVVAEYDAQDSEFSDLISVEKIVVSYDDLELENFCGIRVGLAS